MNLTVRTKKIALSILCLISLAFLSALIVNRNQQRNQSFNDFNTDYTIDLQEDGYLIKDERGTVTFVPREKLEEWFLNDNL